MSSNNQNTGGGIGVISLLGVLFVWLKLAGVINWSWWLVTLPFWWWIIPVVLIILFALIFD